MKLNKVLIFGGSGFIGKHYRAHFNNLGVETIVADITKEENYKSNEEFVKTDVRKAITLKIEKVDLLINLAAVHTTPGHKDSEYYETNVLGAKNVCAFAAKNNIKNMLFTSSISIYGPSEKRKFEENIPQPVSAYGISKLQAESIHSLWRASSSERKLLILRPALVFGEGENGNFDRLEALIKKGLMIYPGRKNVIKSCINVDQLVTSSLSIFQKMNSKQEIINFAYEKRIELQFIVNKLKTKHKKNVLSFKIPLFVVKALMVLLSTVKFFLNEKSTLHPKRIEKLTKSTNISGKKLQKLVSPEKIEFQL